jgi:hypothetical protein
MTELIAQFARGFGMAGFLLGAWFISVGWWPLAIPVLMVWWALREPPV